MSEILLVNGCRATIGGGLMQDDAGALAIVITQLRTEIQHSAGANVQVASVSVQNPDGVGTLSITSDPTGQLRVDGLTIETDGTAGTLGAGQVVQLSYTDDGGTATGFFSIDVTSGILTFVLSTPSASIPDNTAVGTVLALGTTNGPGGTLSVTSDPTGNIGVLNARDLGVVSAMSADDRTSGSPHTIAWRYHSEPDFPGQEVTGTLLLTVNDPSAAEVLHTVTLTERLGTDSTGIARFDLSAQKGQVPAGSILACRIASTDVEIPCTNIAVTTYSDGSIDKCTVVPRAGTVPASGGVELEFYPKVATQSASSLDVPAFIAGLADCYRLRLPNRTGSAGTAGSRDGVSYPDATRPELIFDPKTAFADANHVETLEDYTHYVECVAKQKVDEEEHQIVEHVLRLYLDSDGSTVLAWEYNIVAHMPWYVSNPFGIAQTREQYTYDAILEWGSGSTWTEVQSSTGLVQCYYDSGSLTLTQHADDVRYARWQWVNHSGSHPMPTIDPVRSFESRVLDFRTGMLPLSDLSLTPFTAAITHVPFKNNGHSGGGLNKTGGYVARGKGSRFDHEAIILQTALALRNCRVGAQAGLHIAFNEFDHRVWDTQPGLRLLPNPFTQQGAHSYPGLGTEIAHGRVSGYPLTAEPVNGGTGWMTNLSSSSHLPALSYVGAYLFGDRTLMRATQNMADWDMHSQNYDGFGNNLTVNGVVYGVTPALVQQRAWAWSWRCQAEAFRITPDNDPHREYFRNALQNLDEASKAFIENMPAGRQAAGGMRYTRELCNTWQNGLMAFALAAQVEAIEDQVTANGGARLCVEHTIKVITKFPRQNRGYLLDGNQHLHTEDATGVALPSGLALADTNEYTANLDTNRFSDPNGTAANGDIAYSIATLGNDKALTLPPELLPQPKRLVVINHSGTDFQFYEDGDPTFTPIDITAVPLEGTAPRAFRWGFYRAWDSGRIISLNNSGDDWGCICAGALRVAWAFGFGDVTPSDWESVESSWSNPQNDDYPCWKTDPYYIRSA